MTTTMSTLALTDSSDKNAERIDPHFDLSGKRLHFVGIGGCGMSGLARLAKQAGACCTGTDREESETIDSLRQDGIDVTLEQTHYTVPEQCDLAVISAAIASNHPEVLEARRRGIRLVKYAQLLGQLMNQYTGIAVAGTHGKSTTTSLLAHVLIETGLDPSFIVGANCRQIGGGYRVGATRSLLVAEACEFDRSFHNLHPTHAVILNVEEDHLDVYAGLEEIVESFRVFAQKIPPSGTLLIQYENPQRTVMTTGLPCSVETIGHAPQADWQVEIPSPRGDADASCSRGSLARVTLRHQGESVASWLNPLPGEHMAYNAAAAAITAHRFGASWDRIAVAVASFQGLDRRMQDLGTRTIQPMVDDSTDDSRPADSGAMAKTAIRPHVVRVVDDYGHHPTEVDTTLRALHQHYRPKRLICVFQPHQHSRTRFLLEQFAASFTQADIVIVPHIYFVRDSEKERHAVRAADLVDRLRKQGVQAMHLYPFGAIVEQLELIVRDGDLLVTMGAGDVWKVARDFLSHDAGR